MIQLLPNSLLALLPIHALLAQTSGYETAAAPSPIVIIISLAIAILMIAAMWKVFSKAGQPGWAVIIPIYNIYIMCKAALYFFTDPWLWKRGVSGRRRAEHDLAV